MEFSSSSWNVNAYASEALPMDTIWRAEGMSLVDSMDGGGSDGSDAAVATDSTVEIGGEMSSGGVGDTDGDMASLCDMMTGSSSSDMVATREF
jgi:hypothetical protein